MQSIFYDLGDGTYLDSISREIVDHKREIDIKSHALNAIIKDPKRAHIMCIPTWSCNLRCPFCYVGSKLDKEFRDQDIDPNALHNFMSRLKSRYELSRIDVSYLGGEPLIGFNKIKELDEVARDFGAIRSITTNMSVVLTDEIVEFLKGMGQINVSLDGDEERHNKLRKVYRHKDNNNTPDSVYETVVSNIKQLISCGVDVSKIAVQGASSELEPDRLRNLIYDMFEIGISEDQLSISALAPTDKYKIEEYKIPAVVRNIPCCCYRYMEYFVVDGSGLYSNYFDQDSRYALGSPTDSIESIESKYRSMIESQMPGLSDEACMSCEVFGLCWGQCHGHINNGKVKPSSVCSQQQLIEFKNKAVANGTILEKTRCTL